MPGSRGGEWAVEAPERRFLVDGGLAEKEEVEAGAFGAQDT